MFKIHGNDIYVTAGDRAVFSVHPQNDSGEEYVMDTNDRLHLKAVIPGSRRELFSLYTAPGNTEFSLTPELTAGRAGKYAMDVKLLFADGSETTLIGETPNYVPHFVILEG